MDFITDSFDPVITLVAVVGVAVFCGLVLRLFDGGPKTRRHLPTPLPLPSAGWRARFRSLMD